MILDNAALRLWVAEGFAQPLAEALTRSRQVLSSGAALDLLTRLRRHDEQTPPNPDDRDARHPRLLTR